jgi:DnaJ-class molecular chaperone
MNYSSILGVAYDATPEEIKFAYRRLAQVHHPDKGGDVELFKQIKQAYEWLIANPFVEQHYEQHVNPQINPNAARYDYYQTPFKSSFEDIAPKYQDEEIIIHKKFDPDDSKVGFAGFLSTGEVVYRVPLEFAYNGGKFILKIPHYGPQEITLPKLTSDGYKIKCSFCGTSAFVAGRWQEMTIIIRIAEHKIYTISNGDLVCKFVLTLPDLLERLPLKLPHPNGKDTLPINLPLNYNLGEIITIKEKGFKIEHYGVASKGDIVISIVVDIPNLNLNQIRRIRAILNE